MKYPPSHPFSSLKPDRMKGFILLGLGILVNVPAMLFLYYTKISVTGRIFCRSCGPDYHSTNELLILSIPMVVVPIISLILINRGARHLLKDGIKIGLLTAAVVLSAVFAGGYVIDRRPENWCKGVIFERTDGLFICVPGGDKKPFLLPANYGERKDEAWPEGESQSIF